MARGALVCRMGKGYFSGAFRRVASPRLGFSHIGILDEEEGRWSVIHAEASELTGIGDVRREGIEEFASEAVRMCVVVYGDSAVRERTAEMARRYLARRCPFDIDFDCEDDSAVYCTEMVAKCLNYGFGETVVRAEESVGGKKFYGIDGIVEAVVGE